MVPLDYILANNERYADRYGKEGRLSNSPSRHIAVVACMDTRLSPEAQMGLKAGEAHFIRNAGGRASNEAIRSLVSSYKLFGTREFYVVHHTGCGMGAITDSEMAELLQESLSPAVPTDDGFKNLGDGPGSIEGRFIDWLTIRGEPEALIDDVLRIRHHPLIPGHIPIYGLMFDIETGQLVSVPEAMDAGKPKVPEAN